MSPVGEGDGLVDLYTAACSGGLEVVQPGKSAEFANKGSIKLPPVMEPPFVVKNLFNAELVRLSRVWALICRMNQPES
jgi:hypothetical protein